MDLFAEITTMKHDQVVFFHDPSSGLKAIVAIHDTTLGPALGGLRMWAFENEEKALNDVLRLSRGMTYKASVAGLNLGGGKAVIIGDASKNKSPEMMRAFGRYIEGLSGRYITAEDVGTNVDDMRYIRESTKNVVGLPLDMNGSGDPSPYTALGVYYGIKACMKELKGGDSLKGETVSIMGCGHVGYYLAEKLAKDGAKILVTDIKPERAEKIAKDFGATVLSQKELITSEVTVFAPCALGGIINDETLEMLKTPIIAGAANNQLLDETRHGDYLFKKGILYAPDYVINAGGLINVYNEILGYNESKSRAQVENIYTIVGNVLKTSKTEKIPTHLAANRIAEERLRRVEKEKLQTKKWA